jgi:hypothetical protein
MNRIFGSSNPAKNIRLDMTDTDDASTPEPLGGEVGNQGQGLINDRDPDSKVDKASKTLKTNKNDNIKQRNKPKTSKSTKVSKSE